MKFVVNCSELNRVLKIISPAIQKNVVLPILESFKIVKAGKDVVVIATDLHLSIIFKITEITAKEDFDVVIPFKTLNNLVSLHKTSVAEFDVSKKEGVVVLIDGKKFKIGAFEDPKNYPAINDVSADAVAIEIGESILSAMSYAMSCIGENSPYKDVGVLIHGGKITVASTDTFRIFQYIEPVNQKQLKATASVPVEFIRSISNITESDLFIEGNQIRVKSPNTTYIGRLTDQVTPFDPIDGIFKLYKENCVIEKSVLTSALNDILSYGTVLPFVDFFFEENKIKVLFEDVDLNYSCDGVIDVEHSVEIPQIRFNAKQLKIMIDLCDEEEIRFSFPPEGNYTARIANKDLSCKMAIQSLMINTPA